MFSLHGQKRRFIAGAHCLMRALGVLKQALILSRLPPGVPIEVYPLPLIYPRTSPPPRSRGDSRGCWAHYFVGTNYNRKLASQHAQACQLFFVIGFQYTAPLPRPLGSVFSETQLQAKVRKLLPSGLRTFTCKWCPVSAVPGHPVLHQKHGVSLPHMFP